MNATGARYAIATAAAAAFLTMTEGTFVHAEQTAGVEAGGPADWNTFFTEISISRGHGGTDDGAVGPPVPRTRYELERRLGPSGWRTTITLVAMDRPMVDSPRGPRPVSNPFRIGRTEFDGSGAAPIAYDAFGRVISLPTAAELEQWTETVRSERPDLVQALQLVPGVVPADRRPTGPPDRDWIEHVMPSLERHVDRRQSVRTRFGHAVGSERGLERYLADHGGLVYELLLDPAAAVPAEMNVLRDGQLRSHTVFAYQANEAGRLVLKSVRVEERPEATADRRVITELEYSNMRLSWRER